MPKPVNKTNCISWSSLVTSFAEVLRKVITDIKCFLKITKIKKNTDVYRYIKRYKLIIIVIIIKKVIHLTDIHFIVNNFLSLHVAIFVT